MRIQFECNLLRIVSLLLRLHWRSSVRRTVVPHCSIIHQTFVVLLLGSWLGLGAGQLQGNIRQNNGGSLNRWSLAVRNTGNPSSCFWACCWPIIKPTSSASRVRRFVPYCLCSGTLPLGRHSCLSYGYSGRKYSLHKTRNSKWLLCGSSLPNNETETVTAHGHVRFYRASHIAQLGLSCNSCSSDTIAVRFCRV